MAVRYEEFRLAIHQTLGCRTVRLVQSYEVAGAPAGCAPSDGMVHLFELEPFPHATHCFAWVHEVDAGTVTIPAVLQSDAVRTAEQAVRAWRR